MSGRSITIAVVAVLVVSQLGCHPSPTAPGDPQPVSGLGSETGYRKGGNKGGGGTVLMSVTLADGMTADGDMPVQIDSSKTLDLEGPMLVTTQMGATAVGGSCEQIQGAAVDTSYLVDFLTDVLDTFRTVIVVDRRALPGVSDKHRITLGWDQVPGSDDRLFLMNIREGENGAMSVTEDPPDTFTFTGGDVRLVDKSIPGPPKNRVIVRCFNQNSITVTVSSS